MRKPDWIRVAASWGSQREQMQQLLRRHQLNTVCEEARCPNLTECFQQNTATILILGNICTRRCPFCNISHGVPQLIDPDEPQRIATTIEILKLRYVVLTSVTRDDLRDGGASHFAACIQTIRQHKPEVKIEILVPDFRGHETIALKQLTSNIYPDVFNHNLETIERLYPKIRPGASYLGSLKLLEQFKLLCPQVATKSGIMLGFGENQAEIIALLKDLRAHGCDRVTLGQYLQPTSAHLPVVKYWTPEEFKELQTLAEQIGFTKVISGPLVRSSYQAELNS